MPVLRPVDWFRVGVIHTNLAVLAVAAAVGHKRFTSSLAADRAKELEYWLRPARILQRSAQLLGNARYWLEHGTFRVDECLVRFHHQIVSKIHPFFNGNGRHARMMTDVIAARYGRPEFTWGAGANLVDEGSARTAYLDALRALDTDENDVKPLISFARS